MDYTIALKAEKRLKEFFHDGYDYDIRYINSDFLIELVKLIDHQEAIIINLESEISDLAAEIQEA